MQLGTLQGIKTEVTKSHQVVLPMDLLSGSTKEIHSLLGTFQIFQSSRMSTLVACLDNLLSWVARPGSGIPFILCFAASRTLSSVILNSPCLCSP